MAKRRLKTLPAVRPNRGLEVLYRKRLDALVEEMHRSLLYWIGATYKAKPPEMAQDKSPAATMQEAIDQLRRRWEGKFEDTAPRLAKWFSEAAADRSDKQLEAILRNGGISVKFTLSRAANDVLQATTAENVSLIKSIGQQHLGAVEQAVMRSVQQGRDLGTLAQELEARYGVTKRRAAFIAIDQNNKATAAIQRVRQQSVGIKQAVWVHSGAGAHPRPSHVKAGADKVVYDVATGWFDPDEGVYCWPGTLIRCRCISMPVVPGFEDDE